MLHKVEQCLTSGQHVDAACCTKFNLRPKQNHLLQCVIASWALGNTVGIAPFTIYSLPCFCEV